MLAGVRGFLSRRREARERMPVRRPFPGPGAPRGEVLVSYLPEAARLGPGAIDERGHTSLWECRAIVEILEEMGRRVDVVRWDDDTFVPEREYEAVLDIHRNLRRLAGPGSRKLFHVSGSDPRFSNAAERRRLEELAERRGVRLAPRRSFAADDVEVFHGNLAAADTVTLLGNEATLRTFPAEIRERVRRIPVSGSRLATVRDPRSAAFGREFLWFGGAGAVHKGLDRVLEVFARRPDLRLHVVGPYLQETDFVEAYRRELSLPQVVSHGWMSPSSSAFAQLARHVSAFLHPSCSEGASTAAVTCMQFGLLPVLTPESGLDLPEGTGFLLPDASLSAIEAAVQRVLDLPREELRERTARTQAHASATYSREAFTGAMRAVLREALAPRGSA